MSLTSDERKAVVEFRIEKARRALEQAQGVVELQYWETIANRLYYAAYNAVSAMLIAYGYMAQRDMKQDMKVGRKVGKISS